MTKHRYSSLAYGRTVFAADVLLAIFWVAILIYLSIDDHDAMIPALLFALHFTGLIALATIMDEAPGKKEPVHSDGYAPKYANANINTNANDEGVDDADALYDPKHYPVSWSSALFIASITDTFSIVEVHESHSAGHVKNTTYYLLMTLFSLGLLLTVLTFVWITVYYFSNAATNASVREFGAVERSYGSKRPVGAIVRIGGGTK